MAVKCAELCRKSSKQSGTVGTVQCSSSTMQSKISLNVRNELEKTRRLWRLDVIIMRGCQGHEDECCWLPSVPPQCQPFTDRHCRRAETSSLKGTFEIFYVFYYYELHIVLYFLFLLFFFLLSRLLILPSRLPLFPNLQH